VVCWSGVWEGGVCGCAGLIAGVAHATLVAVL